MTRHSEDTSYDRRMVARTTFFDTIEGRGPGGVDRSKGRLGHLSCGGLLTCRLSGLPNREYG
jgi:hypothetical protein